MKKFKRYSKVELIEQMKKPVLPTDYTSDEGSYIISKPMTPITEDLIKELKPFLVENDYGRNKFYFEVVDVDPSEDEKSYIWIVQGNGSDEQFWNIGFWRTHGGMNVPAHNVTIRHGIRYIETFKEFMSWYSNRDS